MRSASATQFSIEVATKDRLDRFKMQNKNEILTKRKAKRRMATNTMVIDYLLDLAKAKR